MALQPPIDYGVGVPSVSNPLEMIAAGLAERQKLALSRGIGQQISAGNYQGAAGAAFGGGEMQSGIAIAKMGQEDKDRSRSILFRHITAADTPEKYARVVPIIAQQIGPQFAEEYGDFSMRDQALAELGTDDQLTAAQTRADKAAEAPDTIEIGDPANPDKKIKAQWDAASGRFVPVGAPYGEPPKPPEVIETYENGQPRKMQWDAASGKYVPIGDVKAPTKGGGIRVTTNADGTTTTEIGGEGDGLGTAGSNELDRRAINTAEQGSRLAGIMASFKPEYQTLYNKAINARRSWQAWLSPSTLGPGDKQELSNFVEFRTKAFKDFSAYLQELSGAAISTAEFGRLSQSMPNPGTGLWDGDDPVTFEAKMKTVASELERALVRYQFYQTDGIPASLDAIPLNNVKQANGHWYVKKGAGWFPVGGEGDAAQPN